MEQPLDLSQQREQPEETTTTRMETDDVVCPYVNCNCPLRHAVPSLDLRHTPHLGHLGHVMAPILRPPFGYLPGFYNDAMLLDPSSVYANSRNVSVMHDMGRHTNLSPHAPSLHANSNTNLHSGITHPKRRKVEQHQQARSPRLAYDEDASSNSKFSVSPQIRFFRPGFPSENNGESSSPSSASVSPTPSFSSSTSSLSSSHSPTNVSSEKKTNIDDDSFRTPKRISSSDSAMMEGSPAVNDLEDKSAQRERSKTISYMERLPKKRIAGRYLSQDTSQSSSSTTVSHDAGKASVISHDAGKASSASPGIDVISVSDRHVSRPMSGMDNPSLSVSPVAKETTLKVKPEYDVSALKADMIREIDEAEKQEKNSSTQKTTYIGYGKSSPNNDTSPESDIKLDGGYTKHPGGVRMTALDYLISKTLLQREDRPYKARNHHIHQIIRGEKPGKLCLMDIVELQVEIGLA